MSKTVQMTLHAMRQARARKINRALTLNTVATYAELIEHFGANATYSEVRVVVDGAVKLPKGIKPARVYTTVACVDPTTGNIKTVFLRRLTQIAEDMREGIVYLNYLED